MPKPFRFAMPGHSISRLPGIFASLACLVASSLAPAQDVERGRRLFEECAACHAPDISNAENVGPNLAGVIGRRAGTRDDFRYSGPLKRSGVEWNRASLEQFIADPQALVPGNRMPYSGMPDAADRKALMDYLERAGLPARP
jgi:cytochrome c